MAQRNIHPVLLLVAVLVTLYLLHTFSQNKCKTYHRCFQFVEPAVLNERKSPKALNLYHNVNSDPENENPSAISQKHPGSSHDNDDPTLDELESILKHRLKQASEEIKPLHLYPLCDTEATISNSCDNNTCLRLNISENPRDRLAQLIEPAELRVPVQVKKDMQSEMTSKINEHYDIVMMTAATDNHFEESQALLEKLHSNIFPNLKNFTLIYYDLGLSTGNRQLLEKACDCTVLDFPFDKFPPFVKKDLRCFTWKSAMINAHLSQSNVLIWLDSSIRFHDFKGFSSLVENTRKKGFQFSADASVRNPFRTDRRMFHYFGDEPCAHLPFGQAAGGFLFFKNDRLVKRAVLEPWMACTLRQDCVCPKRVSGDEFDRNRVIRKNWREGKGAPVFGLVHRHDQSAINLVLGKLFAQYYYWGTFQKGHYNVTFYNRRAPTNYLLNRSKLLKVPKL